MLDLFQILEEAGDPCKGIGPVVALIKNGVFPIIQIGIPILLVLMGTIDLGKAVMSNDDKEIKAATGKLIKRAIAAVAVFFVVFLVNLVFGWIGTARSAEVEGEETIKGESDWFDCWDNVT